MYKFITALICFLYLTPVVVAKGIYQTKEQFISHAFTGNVPKAKVLWLNSEDKKVIADILSHQYKRLRIHYWQNELQAGVQQNAIFENKDSVWILDEIGKEKPITIGIHIKNQQIVELKVLAFRESRGDEVRHEFFTSQFNAVKLTSENKLNQHIDGITGATLSVRALTKVARLALWLNKKVNTEQ